MKVLNFVFGLMFLSVFALTSCQSEKADNTAENAEAAVNGQTANAENTIQPAVANGERATPVAAGPTTSVEFDETTYDFGTITDGDKVRHTFKFKNTGSEPLILSNCKGSCGCTVPQCPKDPIAPGDGGEITVEYNSRGKSKGKADGNVDQKFVNVTANTDPGSTRLTIKANVLADPNAPKPEKKKVDSK